MSKKYVQTNTFYLAGSGVIVGATSIVLTSFTDIYGNVLTMTDFGDTGYITLEPDTTNEEAATFTGVTANANNTYTLTGVKTNLAKSPYTETSGLVRPHSGGTKVVVTDNVAFWNTFGNTANTNTWAATQTFSVPAVQATDPTLSTQVANKSYVDGVAIAGAPKATDSVYGITKLSVAAASPTVPIAVGDNDTRVPTQDENNALVGNNTDVAVGTGNKFVTQTGLQHNAESFATDTSGSSTAYIAALSPIPTSLTDGMKVSVKFINANTTTTPTLNLNSLTARTIVNPDGSALLVGAISANMIAVLSYDLTNTRWILLSASATPFSRLLYQSSVALTQNVANTSKNALITKSIIGGLLSTANVIKLRFEGTVDNVVSGVVNTITVDYGSETVWAVSPVSASVGISNFIAEVYIYATGSASTQTSKGSFFDTQVTATANALTGHNLRSNSPGGINSTQNSGNAQNLVVSTQLNTTVNAPTLVIENYTIEILR